MMSSTKTSAADFIRSEFSPHVAVICSSDANRICAKNELSFVELVQPFFKLPREVSIRDPSNSLNTLQNFQLTVRDINYQPLQPAFAKKLLNDAVSQSQYHIPDELVGTKETVIGIYTFQTFTSTPWFEDYRNIFFRVFYPSNHEFFHHNLACMFVVSSSSPQPLEDIASLLKEQQTMAQSSSSTTKWFFTNILKYFVLLHDVVEGDTRKAEEVYQQMKGLYGASVCHLLQINSFSNDSPDGSFTDSETSSSHNPWVQKTFAERQPYGEVDGAAGRLTVSKSYSFPKPSPDENVMDSSTEDILSSSDSAKDPSLNHPLVLDMENPSPTSFKEDLFSEVSSYSGQTRSEHSQQKTPGACLTVSDVERIQTFATEFCTSGLFPFVESQLRILNEQVTTRKGLHRSLFSATKKWLASGKPGVQNPSSVSNTVVYNSDAPELQVRRLGDLAFMFQLYELAYQSYHAVKREFQTDQAWLYFAGALEMAALSVFMQGLDSSRQYPMNYMEMAITTYLSTCKSLQLATRATILSVECLKTKGLYNDAAAQLIRLTSEDSDLRSALLLEQAALCFLKGRPPFARKYAFHMVLAGHRFSKAGHKKHALRAYKLAHQVYQGRGWRVSEDHINYTMGRLSITLNRLSGAGDAYRSLLLEGSLQPQMQQVTILKEFINVMKHTSLSGSPGASLPLLPIPIVDGQLAAVFVGSAVQDAAGCPSEAASVSFLDAVGEKTWLRLEEMAVIHAKGSLPFGHKPQLQCRSNGTDNTSRPVSAVDEVITVSVPLKNILHIPLVLFNVCLLWQFTPDGNEDAEKITNEGTADGNADLSSIVETHIASKVILQSLQTPRVLLSLTPHRVGQLEITGIAYDLHGVQPCGEAFEVVVVTPSESEEEGAKKSLFVRGWQPLTCKGPRLNNTKAEKMQKTYGVDYRFQVSVLPPMPRLKVTFSEFPTEMLCGEVRCVTTTFHNEGQRALHGILVASPTPELLCFEGQQATERDAVERVWKVPRLSAATKGDALQPGELFDLPLWVRAPDAAGSHNLDFLFYYEGMQEDNNAAWSYRISCQRAQVVAKPSLSLRAVVGRNCNLQNGGILQGKDVPTGGLNVDLQVENVSEASRNFEFEPVRITGSSRKWQLTPLTQDEMDGNRRVIHNKETLHLIFKAVPSSSVSDDSSGREITSIDLNAAEKDHFQEKMWVDFLSRSGTKLPPLFDDAWPSYETSGQGEGQPGEADANPCLDPAELLKQAEITSSKIDLLLGLTWRARLQTEAGVHIISGQHHLLIENVDSLDTLSGEDEKDRLNYDPMLAPLGELGTAPNALLRGPLNGGLKRLVNFSVQHPMKVDHAFSQNRICIVPVGLVAQNCCEVTLCVHVDTSRQAPSSEYEPVGLSPCSSPTLYRGPTTAGFAWMGPTQLSLKVDPGKTVHIPLKAAFSAPGMYNLTNMTVSASPGLDVVEQMDSLCVVQQPLCPSLITIEGV